MINAEICNAFGIQQTPENQDKQKVRKSYFDKKQNYPKRKKEDWFTRVCIEIYISAIIIIVFN